MNIISKASNRNNQSDSSCQIRHADIMLLQNNTPNVRVLRQIWLYNGKQHSMCFMEAFGPFRGVYFLITVEERLTASPKSALLQILLYRSIFL